MLSTGGVLIVGGVIGVDCALFGNGCGSLPTPSFIDGILIFDGVEFFSNDAVRIKNKN